MGGIVKAIGGLLGGLLGGGQQSSSSPSITKTETAPATTEVDTAQKQSVAARTALLETAGGASGAPLQPGQVNDSKTLFAN